MRPRKAAVLAPEAYESPSVQSLGDDELDAVLGVTFKIPGQPLTQVCFVVPNAVGNILPARLNDTVFKQALLSALQSKFGLGVRIQLCNS